MQKISQGLHSCVVFFFVQKVMITWVFDIKVVQLIKIKGWFYKNKSGRSITNTSTLLHTNSS